ncbi:MAG TPA: aminodeoxychorismate synthase component I [Pyrinomonadaceae bacterium]|nr:aminodeoxychorismate synthase component I [Pyrinomonadaceae bacterium]
MIEASFGWRYSPSNPPAIRFQAPLKILIANRNEEVLPLLAEAEATSRAGYWVALMISYEAAPAFDPAMKTRPPGGLPLVWAAVFSSSTESANQSEETGFEIGAWEPLVSHDEFGKAILRIREFIAAGDTYQVNYTFPLVATFKGDPLSWFRRLCSAQGAAYCAYFDLGRYQILSISPELFFEQEGRAIRTRPMKGTIRRGRWPDEDMRMAEQLAGSAKDRAENVMIVDLLRNDLGRVAVPGSVKVTSLFELERYETLWQMTSTIEATLRTEVGFPEVMAKLFPCGSITGAPKIRTMEIIRELEPFHRGVYTGTLGFLRPGGSGIFNVAIRTVVVDAEQGLATFGVGGGITYDSTVEREYEECLVKSSFLNSETVEFELLESLLLDDSRFFLAERHVARMKASAAYFGFRFNEAEIDTALFSLSRDYCVGRWKVRLLSGPSGAVSAQVTRLEDPKPGRLRVALANQPVSCKDKFLFHKTTNRKLYDDALAARSDCDDVILWNENGEATESTVANLVIRVGDELLTPPRSAGLLAGVFREELVVNGQIRERSISRDDLAKASELFLINSVRKWMRATLVI